MKRFILLLLLALPPLALNSAKPSGGTTGWRKLDTNLSRWTASSVSASGGDVATMPIQSTFANYTAFLLTNMTGNISGKTITAVFTVQVTSGDPGYVWGGYNAPGDWGTRAEAGLYFSTHTDYPRNGNPSDPDNYWFTPFTRVSIDDALGTVTLSCPVQPANWSQSFGALGSDPSHTAGFMSACQNVHTVGIALASEHFYDTGIATTNGTAVLHLQSFTVQ